MASDDFFAAATPTSEPVAAAPEDDVTNHDLLAELLSQLSPEEQAAFHAKEAAEAEAKAKKSAAVEASPVKMVTETAAAAPVAKAVSAPVAANSGSAGNGNKGGVKKENSAIKVDRAC